MSNDLISRQDAIDALTDTNLKRNVDSVCDGDMNRTRRAAQRVIAQLPTIDAVEVVHGEWIAGREIAREMLCDKTTHIFYENYKCSVCGLFLDKLLFNVDGTPFYKYCPSCGAKMDGEEKKDEQTI